MGNDMKSDENVSSVVEPTEKVEAIKEIVKTAPTPMKVEAELDNLVGSSLTRVRELRDGLMSLGEKTLPQLQGDTPLAKTLTETNLKLAELNPNNVMGGFLWKYVPLDFVRKALLKPYIENFKNQSEQVQSLFVALEDGTHDLKRKMIELEMQYEDLAKTEKEIDADLTVLEAAEQWLDSLDTGPFSEVERYKHEAARNKVKRRIRDLHTAKAAIQQFYVSIHQMMNAQRMLEEQVDSIMFIGPTILVNAIMIHSAISQQKVVVDAVNEVQKTLSVAMSQNAEMIRQNAEDVARLYNNPVLALDELRSNYEKLSQAVEITRKAMNESSETAARMSQELKKLQQEFAPIEASLRIESEKRKEIEQS